MVLRHLTQELMAQFRAQALAALLRSINKCKWQKSIFSFFCKSRFSRFFFSTLCHFEESDPNEIPFKSYHGHDVYTKPTKQNLSTPFLRFSRDDQIWRRGQKWSFFTHFWTCRFQHQSKLRDSNLWGRKGNAQGLPIRKHKASIALLSPGG